MTEAFRPWLPANAAAPAPARGALADLADGWSRAWFAGEPMRAAGSFSRVAETRGELRKAVRHVCEGALAIEAPPAAALGARVLGVAAAGERRPADLALLERMGGECLDDLKRRAAAAFPLGQGAAWSVAESRGGGVAHRIEIADAARAMVLTLELGDALFAAFVKAKLPAAAPRPPLGAPDAALARLPVRLSAALGGCRLTVAELCSLAAGDVLVLDRALDAALPLAVDGRPALRGACTVAEHGGAVALEITQALAG